MNTSKHYFDVKKIPAEITSKTGFYSVEINTDTSIVKAAKNLLLSSKPYNAERFISAEFKTRLSELLQKNDYDIIP